MHMIFDFFGSAVCHQMAERTLYAHGTLLSWCARCTGIYLSIFIGTCFLFLRKRQNGSRPFSLPQALCIVICILPLAIDGAGSYLGLWQSTALRRLLSGALAGWCLPGLFLLAGNFSVDGENARPIYRNVTETLLLPLCAVLLCLLLLWSDGYTVISFCCLLGEIVLFGGVWYIMLQAIGSRKIGLTYFCSLCGAIATICLIAGLQI